MSQNGQTHFKNLVARFRILCIKGLEIFQDTYFKEHLRMAASTMITELILNGLCKY